MLTKTWLRTQYKIYSREKKLIVVYKWQTNTWLSTEYVIYTHKKKLFAFYKIQTNLLNINQHKYLAYAKSLLLQTCSNDTHMLSD